MKTSDGRIQLDNYRDYIIKNRRFIGDFEGIYQNIDDPWYHGLAIAIQYDLILLLLKRYSICKAGGSVLDIGCGKGAFTARIKKTLPSCSVTGVDISPTAIRYAKKTYGPQGIKFDTPDIQERYSTLDCRNDLIIISQIAWYILQKIREILDYLVEQALAPDGYLLIGQAFYKPEEQTYGKEIFSTIKDLVGFIKIPRLNLLDPTG